MVDGKTIIREPGTHVVDAVILNSPITDDSQAATKEYVDDHSGGGPAQTPLNGKPKAIANNTTTGIFTFPLADGQAAVLHLGLQCLAKKGSDWAIGQAFGSLMIYNDGGSLYINKDASVADDHDNGGAVSLAAFGNFNLLSATISTGIVTVTINPGNVGTDPDSIDLDFTISNPKSKVITFL